MYFRIKKLVSPLLTAILLLPVILLSCKHEPEDLSPVNPGSGDTIPVITDEPVCDPDTVYFQNDVLPILISGCGMSGCHDAETAQERVILTSYESVIRTGKITPGNPSGSKLYNVITTGESDDRMPPPPRASLTSEQIQLIRTWIEQGARNNFCTADCDTSDYTYSTAIQPLVNTYCKGCHNSVLASGGLNLESYSAVKSIAVNGSFLGSISHEPGYSAMPKGGAMLSSCQITRVRKWIESGAPEN